MKLYLMSIIVWGVLTSTVFAQVNVDEMKPQPQEDIVVPEGMIEFTQEENDFVNNLPSVEITELTLNKEDYQSGETVNGSFKIRNERDYRIPNLRNTIALTKTEGDYKRPVTSLDVYEVSGISLGSLETKKIDFSYTLPKHISGEYFGLRTTVTTDIGSSLSWADAKVVIWDTISKEYVVKNPFLQIEDEKVSLYDGPIVKENRPAYVHINIINPYEEDTDIDIVSSIYEKGIGGEKIKEYKNKFTLEPGLNENISVRIQIDGDSPGIYDGTLTIKDAKHTPASQLIEFHYVVDGPMVNIHSVEYDGFNVNNFSLEKGDDFSVILNYSGEMVDFIDSVDLMDVYLDSKINLTNEGGMQIASWTEKVNYNQGFSKKVDFTSEIDTNSMNVDIEIIDENENIIAKYEDEITSNKQNIVKNGQIEANSNKDNKWLIIMIIVIMPFIIVLVGFFKKSTFSIFILFTLLSFGFLNLDIVEARGASRTWGYVGHHGYPSLNIVSPSAKICGGDEFAITGTITRLSCGNSISRDYVSARGYGAWSISYYGGTRESRNIIILDADDLNFIAPSEPGTYRIWFDVNLYVYKTLDDGRSTWYIDYEVESCEPECTGTVPTEASVCPGSDIDLTEDFEWRRAENDNCSNEKKCEYYFSTDGVCNSNTMGEYELNETEFRDTLCDSGMPSPASVDFPAYGEEVSWNCIGTGGGSSTENGECKATREKPESKCGASNGASEINSEAGITNKCGIYNESYGPVTFDEFGVWNWDCVNNYYITQGTENLNLANPSCSAQSCLAGEIIQYNSNVYLKQNPNDQTTTVSIDCGELNEVCCDIQATDKTTGALVTHVCTGDENKEIIVQAGLNIEYLAQCYIVKDGCEVTDTCPKVGNPLTISTMCAQKECNTQGSCQSTPKPASDTSECSSTCNSNADCSSGRIIETQP